MSSLFTYAYLEPTLSNLLQYLQKVTKLTTIAPNDLQATKGAVYSFPKGQVEIRAQFDVLFNGVPQWLDLVEIRRISGQRQQRTAHRLK